MYYYGSGDDLSSASTTTDSTLDFGLGGLRQRFSEVKEAVTSFVSSKKNKRSHKGISLPSFMSYLKGSTAAASVSFWCLFV